MLLHGFFAQFGTSVIGEATSPCRQPVPVLRRCDHRFRGHRAGPRDQHPRPPLPTGPFYAQASNWGLTQPTTAVGLLRNRTFSGQVRYQGQGNVTTGRPRPDSAEIRRTNRRLVGVEMAEVEMRSFRDTRFSLCAQAPGRLGRYRHIG